MTTKSCTRNLPAATYERNTSMNRIAFRSDCNRARPMLVFVVTKNVRERRISAALELRSGFDMVQGLKPSFLDDGCGTSELVP